MAEYVLGAQLYTVRQSIQTLQGVRDSLEKIAAIGYKAIEISLGTVPARDVAHVVEDSGLTVASAHTHWGRFLNDLDAVIEEHVLWKCNHAAIGGLPEEYLSLDGLKRFLDEVAPIAGRLAQEGMDFSYHNHSHELACYGEKTWLAMLYEQADPVLVKAEIDVYWIQAGGGDPAQWVRNCAGREPLLHLKDMAVTSEREQRFAEIGEGNLNWAAILNAAREGGVQCYLVEQDDCYGRDPFESLAISYRNLRSMGLS
ncbi:MAG: sugar phosphate isomerase/epimerase [Anaerolineae bacterium]|nr:sugar phosphate isomerase/epimerase [Anaerolineae bacterium]